jgi:pSer/pThr/pTyr-binding forkhead associated (FHA) protein
MVICPNCKTENSSEDKFCMNCGSPLGQAKAPSFDDLIEAGIVCPNCDTYNDAKQKTCINCQHPLSGLTGYLQAVTLEPSESPAPKVEEPSPQQPSFAPPLPPPSPPDVTTGKCPHCQATLTPAAKFCLTCGQAVVPAEVQAPSATPAVAPAPSRLQLRLVRGSGQAEATFTIEPQGSTIGRKESANITMAQDPNLSPLHATIKSQEEQIIIEDNDSYNGTFVRIRGKALIQQGSEMAIGRQRYVLLGIGGPTADVRTTATDDTRAYGGPVPKHLFVALRPIHVNSQGQPVAGAVILRAGPTISMGRKNCDINFPNDDLIADKHMEFRLSQAGAEAVETGASNGVFVRINSPTKLYNGDEFLVGNQVLRLEKAPA